MVSHVRATLIALVLTFAFAGEHDFSCSLCNAQERPTQEKAITRKPVTFELTIPKDILARMPEALQKEPPVSVRASVRGFRIPKEWEFDASVRAFVNVSGEKFDTSIDNPSFAHAFTFSPLDPNKPQNIVINLSQALVRKNWKPGEPITLTFVIFPPSPDSMPAELRIPFQEIVVTMPKTK